MLFMFQNKDKDLLGIYQYGVIHSACHCLTDRHLKVRSIVLCKMFSRWFFANKKLIMTIRKLKFEDVTYNVMS